VPASGRTYTYIEETQSVQNLELLLIPAVIFLRASLLVDLSSSTYRGPRHSLRYGSDTGMKALLIISALVRAGSVLATQHAVDDRAGWSGL